MEKKRDGRNEKLDCGLENEIKISRPPRYDRKLDSLETTRVDF